jgi:hypothetical protein
MRSFFFPGLISLLFLPALAFSQETETLFSGEIEHGGYGAMAFGVTSVNGEAAYLRGIRGAWVMRFRNGHSLHLGYSRYRTGSNFDAVNWDVPGVVQPEMRTNYRGFEVEYTNQSYRLIHFGAQTLIGSGQVRFRDRNENFEKNSDNYFVIQPGASVHLNLTNWFRVSGGLFYRHAANVNLEGTSSSDLSGLSAIFGLRFGKF